ncbi:hypothetical protein IZU99_08195 [Oscillospiraceae bacterium CM]|nr:hypothetical protein IZU99_08195 [Oscillospiraceae bacterium CM]
MSSTLFDYEWQFLVQLITRMTYCQTYEETCEMLLQQLKTLIPFQSGLIFQAAREDGAVELIDPISTGFSEEDVDRTGFSDGSFSLWDDYLAAPSSVVFRLSDVVAPARMEKTRVYRDCWQRNNIYWGLFASLACKDRPLAVLGLLRRKIDDDFSARDIYIFNTLKDPLERKLQSLLAGGAGAFVYRNEKIARAASGYGLTKRETEIVSLVCSSKSSEEMCRKLSISRATLSKHLSNIYIKTKVRSRTQLFGLFAEA